MDNCPNCGADLPPNAKSCPECGSDDNTGWSDAAETGGLGLPDGDFNYDKFVEEEFGRKKKVVPHGLHPFWWIVGIIVLATLVYLWVRF